MKILLVAVSLLSVLSLARAQAWRPLPGHTETPIWPGVPPNARPSTAPETVIQTGVNSLVAGKPWTYVNAVSRPTITVYKPIGRNTGTAVVVFPGGGYQILAIDLEGTEVCDWLTARGVTCVLLKYRVPGEAKLPKSGAYPQSAEALQDAQRAVGLVRFHVPQWQIDPRRIGVLGFSAGGHLAAAISVHFDRRLYAAVDAADKESCRPDFAVAIYPGHLSIADNSVALNPDIRDHITSRRRQRFCCRTRTTTWTVSRTPCRTTWP